MKLITTLFLLTTLSAHASLNHGSSVEQLPKQEDEKLIKDQKSLPEKKQPTTLQGEIQKEEEETGETKWYGDRRRQTGNLVPYGIK